MIHKQYDEIKENQIYKIKGFFFSLHFLITLQQENFKRLSANIKLNEENRKVLSQKF